MPRLRDDSATWVAELRRLEDLGFNTVSSSTTSPRLELAPIVARRRRGQHDSAACPSLVAQNPFQHPALLAKDIATIDRLSAATSSSASAQWLADDYTSLGIPFESGPDRVAQCATAMTIIREYFTKDSVDFAGHYYSVKGLEALPRSSQQPPPILLGAAGPRMLDLAGLSADIVACSPAWGPATSVVRR